MEMGMIVCGSPATVRQTLEMHWNAMKFDNLLTMLQFASLPADLTRRNMELFAKEVLPALQALKSKPSQKAPA
jgi:hypothetical protein